MDYIQIYNSVKLMFKNDLMVFYNKIDPRIEKLYNIAFGIDLSECKYYKLKIDYDKYLVFITGSVEPVLSVDSIMLNDDDGLKTYYLIFTDIIKKETNMKGFVSSLYNIMSTLVDAIPCEAKANSTMAQIHDQAPFILTVKMTIDLFGVDTDDEIFKQDTLSMSTEQLRVIRQCDLGDLLYAGALLPIE